MRDSFYDIRLGNPVMDYALRLMLRAATQKVRVAALLSTRIEQVGISLGLCPLQLCNI